MADGGEVDLPALCRDAVAHFEQDDDFLRAFFRENFYQRVYTLATQVAARSRDVVLLHEPPPADAPPKPPRPTWLERYEHAGGRYFLLWDMDQDALKVAALEREKRGETELHIAGLWRKLASQLPEGKTVGEHFTDDKIDLWARSLKVQYKVNIPTPAKLKLPIQEAAD